MSEVNQLQELIAARFAPYGEELTEMGVNVGKLYTDHGLPVDMALAEMAKRGYTKQQQLAILNGVCQHLVQHKRNSGATEKAIERQRNMNRKMIHDFIKSGETGVY